MNQAAPSALEREIAAAFDWWGGAGLDAGYGDDATAWLPRAQAEEGDDDARATAPPAPVEDRAPRVSVPPVVRVGGDPAGWPADPAGFAAWWLTEESLDHGGAYPRVAPRGAPGAKLMAVVTQPEEGDADHLLSGPRGRLLDGFLRAAGLAPDDAYVAALLPRHTLRPDWEEIGAAGYGAIMAHQISLVRPQRIIAFGRNIPPHLPHEPAQGSKSLSFLHHEDTRIALLPSRDLGTLLARVPARRKLWQDWLEWTGG